MANCNLYMCWKLIIAENKVLSINCLSDVPPERAVEVFFGNKTADQKRSSDKIVGLATSMLTSSVYINIRGKGLFAFSLRGRLRWSVLPVLNQFGFSQGCKNNATDCYFTSAPVMDYCETSLYISNNQGELYSLSVRRPNLLWIQNLSSYDKKYTVTPGNNGFLYVIVSAKAIILALDVFSGDILWERRIGPLSSENNLPVVDSNGWISFGSLDGFLYSVSPEGTVKKHSKTIPEESVIQVSPVLDCSGYAVYISQTLVEGKSSRVIGGYTFVSAFKPKNVVFSLLVPATESFYWSESYPGQFGSNLSQSDLHKFIIDEEMLLAFVAAAKIGNPLPCRSTGLKLSISCSDVKPKSVSVYTGNEREILLFFLFETVILIVFAVIVRFCWTFWSKRKLQNQDLGTFLEKRHSLRIKKKEYDKTISELQQKASEEATTSNTLDNLSNFVRRRDTIGRKLSTTYSLGRDRSCNPQPKHVLPVYDGSTRSYSFESSKNESVTIFHSNVDAYSGDESSLETDSSVPDSQLDREVELVAKEKGKQPIEMASSSDENVELEDMYSSSWETSSGSRGSDLNPFHMDNEEKIVSSTGRSSLSKRRSLSMSY